MGPNPWLGEDVSILEDPPRRSDVSDLSMADCVGQESVDVTGEMWGADAGFPGCGGIVLLGCCSPGHLRTAGVSVGFDLESAVLEAVGLVEELTSAIQDFMAVDAGTGH